MTDITTSGADRFDDVFWKAQTEPITESDEFLRQIAAQADLPALLAALAAATRDTTFLTEDLRPPLPPVDTVNHPHGGMTAAQQEKGRAVAVDALKRLRDEKITSVDTLSEADARAILVFLSNGDQTYLPSLIHELDLAPDKGGRPDGSMGDLPGASDFEVLVVGAGVGGIAAGYRLSQTGLPFTMIEATDGVGGTWLKNSYPGVRLDTPTFGYSYSFAQRSDWPHQFATGGEICDYLCQVADRAGLTQKIEFSTRLIKAVWDEQACVWRVTTRDASGAERERSFSAIISGLGQLDIANIPEIEGMADFKGETVHSAQWREGITWKGKKVAVIGTGASAYQIAPAIVDDVSELLVFQRHAPWMLPTPAYHEPVSDTFAWLVRKVPHYGQWYRLWVTLTGIPGRFHTVTMEDDWKGAPLSVSSTNQKVREELIGRMRVQYEGRPELLELAIPSYPPGAKRMLRDNDVWAAALCAPQTTVVTSPVAQFTEDGIVTQDGVEHKVDLVIFATGFRPSDYMDGVEVVGRGGVELHDFWNGDARAYNGLSIPGFPNLFLLYGPNVGGVVAGSLLFMIERATEFSIKAMREVLARGAHGIDVRPEAFDQFVAWVDSANRRMAWGQPYVHTWYQNATGRVSQIWPYTNVEYWDVTETVKPDDHEFL
ncbi:MAG: NAD(P)/FAD-dependent oxidoreductase [Propionibacteriaceae bacterium]|nr:NAD(P)/FAD-dependent oxidoreductase [Propionibacteriaceae bacterium]